MPTTRRFSKPIRTMAELAAAIGYSRVTVSKAINGHADVPPSTRQLILDRAAELGYRPNAAARSMGKGSTGMLSLVVTSHSTSPTYGGLLRGIQHALEPHDLLLTANEYRLEDLDDPTFSPRIFRELVSDGILLDCLCEVPGFAAAASRVRIPLVYLNHHREADAVYPDDRGGAELGTQQLISLGHRRIVYLDQPSVHYSTPERRGGYEAAMEQAGLEPQVFELPFFFHHSSELVAQLEQVFASADAPTAVLAYHVRQAGAALTAAIRLGLRPGEDLAILSFNGHLITETGLEIATLGIPFAAVGATAVDLLLAKIAAGGAPQAARRVPYGPIEDGETLCRR